MFFISTCLKLFDSIYELRIILWTRYIYRNFSRKFKFLCHLSNEWWIYQFVTFKIFTHILFDTKTKKNILRTFIWRKKLEEKIRLDNILNTKHIYSNFVYKVFINSQRTLLQLIVQKIILHDHYQFVTFKMSTYILFDAKWKKNTVGAFRKQINYKNDSIRDKYFEHETRLRFFFFFFFLIVNELDYTHVHKS